ALEVSRGLPPEILHAHFDREEDGWQLRADVRSLVDCCTMNLCGPWPELPPLDLVLLRNVLIYFDVPTRQLILSKVRRVLQPGGYLVLGGAETTYNLDDDFIPVSFGKTSFFQLRHGSAE